MVINPEGYEVLGNIIKEIQDQEELFQKEADLLFEEISKINEEIRLRREKIDKLSNVRRKKTRRIKPRRINAVRIRTMRGILKNNERARTVFFLELEELNEAIKKDCLEIYYLTLAQKQLEWDGPEGNYPVPDPCPR